MTRGSGPDLVLLPGWGLPPAVFDPWRPWLQGTRTLHPLELPFNGHEMSATDALDAVVRRLLRVAPPCARWVGWSLGGMIALAVAAAAPARVEELILIAATPRFTRVADWPHALDAAELQQFRDSLSNSVPQTLRRFAALCARGCADTVALGRELNAACRDVAFPPPAALQSGLDMLAELDLRVVLRQVPQRLRLILGDSDPLVPATVIPDLRQLRPDIEILHLESAGHTPFLSHKQVCADFVRA